MSLTEQEQMFMQQQQQELDSATLQSQESNNQMTKQVMAIEEQEKNMFKEQLDLSSELETIEHLLRGEVLRETSPGVRDWSPPEDPSQEILTEHGIYLIMNTILFYINKNTLLSNYSEDVINAKMEDFADALNDTIYMECEKVFRQPTFEECKDVLIERIDRKTQLRMFALELNNREANEEGIEKGFIEEIEEKIEEEIEKIREQLMKNKYKRFLIIIRQVQDTVHSTYNRAYQGQERRSIRQHTHVSENINPQQSFNNPQRLNRLNYGR